MRLLLATVLLTLSFQSDNSSQILSVDHYVRVRSKVPAVANQTTQIYVRERVKAGVALRAGTAPQVVLFVHGAGTPGEVAFDLPHEDYSWMAFLADAGLDVFAMDFTGYGRSTRPAPMENPCNLSPEQQKTLATAAAGCSADYPHQLTTIESDWNDLGAVVDYLRPIRHVERVSLIGWSLGGPRSGGYLAQHPEKVDKVVLVAPAYNRTSRGAAPKLPADGVPMNTQSRDEFYTLWQSQVGCKDQVDPGVRNVIWTNMMASDPVGATWGPGVRRAPSTTTWGWTSEVAAKVVTPTLMFAGEYDKQVAPDRVRDLYADLGAREKVFVDLNCSSHYPLWEKNRLLLFRASLEWLTRGSVNGTKEGTLRLGYE